MRVGELRQFCKLQDEGQSFGPFDAGYLEPVLGTVGETLGRVWQVVGVACGQAQAGQKALRARHVLVHVVNYPSCSP